MQCPGVSHRCCRSDDSSSVRKARRCHRDCTAELRKQLCAPAGFSKPLPATDGDTSRPTDGSSLSITLSSPVAATALPRVLPLLLLVPVLLPVLLSWQAASGRGDIDGAPTAASARCRRCGGGVRRVCACVRVCAHTQHDRTYRCRLSCARRRRRREPRDTATERHHADGAELAGFPSGTAPAFAIAAGSHDGAPQQRGRRRRRRPARSDH